MLHLVLELFSTCDNLAAAEREPCGISLTIFITKGSNIHALSMLKVE
jgi:hypothetical protein